MSVQYDGFNIPPFHVRLTKYSTYLTGIRCAMPQYSLQGDARIRHAPSSIRCAAPSARRKPISSRRSMTVTIIMLAMLMPPTISAITPIIRPSVVSESSSVFLACDRSADAVTLHAGAADVRRVGEDTAYHLLLVQVLRERPFVADDDRAFARLVAPSGTGGILDQGESLGATFPHIAQRRMSAPPSTVYHS